MSKIAFVFPGQGTQYVGMGKELYENNELARQEFDNLFSKLDFDLKDIMFNSDEKTISTTRFTQPAMVAVANMATLLLKKNGITPDYVCGLSLGEYSALSAAGVFDPETAIQVVRERGLAMEKAAEGVESAMMAILGLEREPLLDICVGCDGYVSIANYNCPGQLVIAGEKKAVEEAGADGISMINTLVGMRFDIHSGKPIIANKTGGYSGPAIFPVALRMVYQVSQAVNIPVIGMGGISTGRDAIEMMIAGASAVQVGCANLVDPYACPRIIQEMNDELDAMGIENITDIIGKSHQYK